MAATRCSGFASLTPEEIGERLTFQEMEKLTPAILGLLTDSGLIQAGKQREELEAMLALLEKGSMVTSISAPCLRRTLFPFSSVRVFSMRISR